MVSKYVAESITMIAVIIVIDCATYLLTISSPDINKVAMSLYDIVMENILNSPTQGAIV